MRQGGSRRGFPPCGPGTVAARSARPFSGVPSPTRGLRSWGWPGSSHQGSEPGDPAGEAFAPREPGAQGAHGPVSRGICEQARPRTAVLTGRCAHWPQRSAPVQQPREGPSYVCPGCLFLSAGCWGELSRLHAAPQPDPTCPLVLSVTHCRSLRLHFPIYQTGTRPTYGPAKHLPRRVPLGPCSPAGTLCSGACRPRDSHYVPRKWSCPRGLGLWAAGPQRESLLPWLPGGAPSQEGRRAGSQKPVFTLQLGSRLLLSVRTDITGTVNGDGVVPVTGRLAVTPSRHRG